MQRSTFLASLAAGAGLLHAAPAQAAVDEVAIGSELFSQLRNDGEILFDSPFYEHLNEIGSVIATAVRSRYPYPIRYYVVKGDSANAFSVPGGNIYINEPLLDLAKNKDEVAGVLAHETGHMVLHHVAKQIANGQRSGAVAQIGSILAQVLGGPWIGAGADVLLGQAQNAQDASLSRHIEAQADEEGARIIAATNAFNPYGMVWFFQTMTATYGPSQANWMRSHPIDQKRIDDLQHLFASDPATFGKFKDTQQRGVAYW